MNNLKQLIADKALPFVQKPAQYINNELGTIHKDFANTSVKMAFCFPDLYEIGMSNFGLQILYNLINKEKEFLCERVFLPASDLRGKLEEHQLPLFSLESYQPLTNFDLLGVSLQHELSYINFLNVLKLGQIPLESKDRTEKDPYVFAGGHSTFNPLPVSEFLDFALVGEGEEVILEILNFYKDNKDLSRQDFLKEIAAIEGVYVPSLNNPTKKRYIKDLDKIKLPKQLIIPYIDTVHNRINVEIMRGCARACRFCQAGFVMLPKREFSQELILEQIDTLIKQTGYDEVSLTSLSSGDYSNIVPLLNTLIDHYAERNISFTFPSLRVDSFSEDIANAKSCIRQSGLTLAPEAGTQRLRDVVNKNISEAEILSSIERAIEKKTTSIKLYFMIGLPTETDEDIKGIVELAEKLRPILKRFRRANCTINISNYVPKPHTPFQWVEQISIEEIERKQQYLKDNLKGKQFKLRWHTPALSFLEGIFARGDQKLGKVLIKALENNICFDSWDDNFRLTDWLTILKECNVDHKEYFAAKPLDSKLPWDIIDIGVSKSALKKEYQKALGQ